ncbi:MAG: cytochrome c biogenesis protein CcsA [Planctomycetota bacterium]
MTSLVLTLGTLLFFTATPAMELPQSLDLDGIRALPTQHNGRVLPLDTLARDLVESITGEVNFQGHDPVLMLLAWSFAPEHWQKQPLIAIRNSSLRAELQLPADQTEFSFSELVSHQHFMDLVDQLQRRSGKFKPNPLESKVSDLVEKLNILQRIFSGTIIPLIPDAESVIAPWRPLASIAQSAPPGEQAVLKTWRELGTAFMADNAEDFKTASEQLTSTLASLPAAHRPTPAKIALELRYNQWQPFRLAWQILAVGAVLSGIAALVGLRRLRAGAALKVSMDIVALAVLLAGFGLATYGLWMRGQIAGRLPAANMYESLLFLSWGAVAFTIIAAVVALILQRGRVVPLTSAVMGTLALLLSDCLSIDSNIRPVMPVLMDTIWMSIHVPIIMTSYAVLAVAVLIAHAQLLILAIVPRQKKLAENIDRLHYWYAASGAYLLLIGIITGSMWGADSWGRYWGWDPKEVWSLVAFLGYMVILHVRVDRARIPTWSYVLALLLAMAVFGILAYTLAPLTLTRMAALGATAVAALIFVTARGLFATSFKSIVAFWMIIMTYVGVNYVLGTGLHSYAFGTGAVVYYMFLLGGLDLALIALCAVVYLLRTQVASGENPPPGPQALAGT